MYVHIRSFEAIQGQTIMKENSIYKNFRVTKSKPIDEIQCTLIELEHMTTKARVIHIANDDDENVFCIGFQTIPQDSKGVAHILEHTVLCGSKKYPVKDPFFSMLRRSINTFMNAFTGSDFTCYPASSQVEKDFYNLLEVYLDATFYPELKKKSFLQEGHRLEFADPHSIKSPLTFKGVVYNEMKGARSSADERLWHTSMEKLFPDITYRFDSGGAPDKLVDLSYDELVDFHSTFYHPSNALFFFYGDLPLEKHLDFIEDKVLKNFSKPLENLPEIGFQKPFTKPIECTSYYPIEKDTPLTKKTMFSFSFLTCAITDQKTLLALSLLDSVLMDTDASPLKRALLDANLCSQVDSLLDTEVSQIPWVFIFKGCDAKDKKRLYQILLEESEKLTKEPLPQELIDAAIHQMEFSRSEIGEDDYPYGLSLFMRACLPALHNCPTEDGLQIHSLIDTIKNEIKDPKYLPTLIQKYLIDNKHHVLLDLQPDPDLNEKEEQVEKDTLKKIKDSLSDIEKHNLLKQAEELENFQQEQEKQSIECLPNLKISDIPTHTKFYPLNVSKQDNLTAYHHSCFTNKILYLDLLFPLPNLSEFDLPTISFLQSIITELGSGGRSYEENLNEIQDSLGDLNTSLSIYRDIQDPKMYTPVFSVKAKALSRNTPKLFTLVYDLITSPDLTNENRILELLNQQYIMLQSAIPQSAMKYASQMASSGVDEVCTISNQWFGLPYFKKIQSLVQDPSKLFDTLRSLQKQMLCTSNIDLVLSCDDEDFENIKKNSFYELSKLTSKPKTSLWDKKQKPVMTPSQGKIIPAPISFTSQAHKTIGYQNLDAPGLVLASNLMDHLTLHRLIREQGGAYGSGANFSPVSGLFTFYSYRDPHLMSTYEAFNEAIDNIAQGNFSAENLHEAKLTALQGIDAPVSPGQRAIVAYSFDKSGRTKDVREKFRSQLLNTSKEDVIKAAKEHLIPLKNSGTSISFGPKELFEKENFPNEISPV